VGGSPATQLTIAARLKAARSAKRMTLDELVRELLDHDRTHCLELDELASELGCAPAAVE